MRATGWKAKFDGHVKLIHGFAGDINSGLISRGFVEAKLSGLQYIAYSSYSHQTSDPRWRFFVPYARPITPNEHMKVYEYFQQQFDQQIDERCKTRNQIWYTPACPPDAAAQFGFFIGTGSLFDPVSIQVTPAAIAARVPLADAR